MRWAEARGWTFAMDGRGRLPHSLSADAILWIEDEAYACQ